MLQGLRSYSSRTSWLSSLDLFDTRSRLGTSLLVLTNRFKGKRTPSGTGLYMIQVLFTVPIVNHREHLPSGNRDTSCQGPMCRKLLAQVGLPKILFLEILVFIMPDLTHFHSKH